MVWHARLKPRCPKPTYRGFPKLFQKCKIVRLLMCNRDSECIRNINITQLWSWWCFAQNKYRLAYRTQSANATSHNETSQAFYKPHRVRRPCLKVIYQLQFQRYPVRRTKMFAPHLNLGRCVCLLTQLPVNCWQSIITGIWTNNNEDKKCWQYAQEVRQCTITVGWFQSEIQVQ